MEQRQAVFVGSALERRAARHKSPFSDLRGENFAVNDKSDSAPGGGSDDDRLKKAIEQALREIIKPGARYPFSGGLIKVSVDRVDAALGTADLHIGACRFVEGSQFAPFLEKELKARIPQLRRVGVGMSEL